MTPTPLHRLAAAARENLEATRDDSEPGHTIRACVRERGRHSINMKPGDLEHFLGTGRRLNAFEKAADRATSSGRSPEHELREHLGRWFEARVAFEQKAGDGVHFHYGALNIGGMGIPQFGRYCVIDIRAPDETAPDPVWIVEDSLSGHRLRDASGELDWDLLGRAIAPCNLAPELAAIKLSDPVAQQDNRALEQRICCEDDYIEAVSVAPIVRERVEEIRSESDEILQDRALDQQLRGASASERLDLGLHKRVRALAEQFGIRWVQVQP